MKAKAKNHPIVKQARDIILSKKTDELVDLNVNAVARQMNISTAHLSRTFKEQMGYNIKDMINAYIIDHGRKLLRRGKKVQEVVDILGCSSVSYFRKMFLDTFGLNPQWYRVLKYAPPQCHQQIVKKSGIQKYLK